MNEPLLSFEAYAGREAAAILPKTEKAADAFARLFTIIARLRAPDGCPWDREQNPHSIRNNILEEAYELVEAINEGEPGHMMEECGDLAMLAAMVAFMCEQSGAFTAAQALDTASSKLVRRHPHVFGDSDVDTPEKVVAQWNQIKETKEGRRKKDSILDEVPRHLPPLDRAYKLQKKAAKVGFDWREAADVWGKAAEELAEAHEASRKESRDELEEEFGDLFFTFANLARKLGVDPSIALQRANDKFSHRFRHIEKRMKEKGAPLDPEHFGDMDAFWEEAKGLAAPSAPTEPAE